MFEEAFIDKLSAAVAAKIAKSSRGQYGWPQLMTVETAAAYMDRTPEAIRNLNVRGILPSTKIDGRLQFRRQDIDRIIEKSTS